MKPAIQPFMVKAKHRFLAMMGFQSVLFWVCSKLMNPLTHSRQVNTLTITLSDTCNFTQGDTCPLWQLKAVLIPNFFCHLLPLFLHLLMVGTLRVHRQLFDSLNYAAKLQNTNDMTKFYLMFFWKYSTCPPCINDGLT